MHKKAWGQAEQKLFKGLGQVFGLCALSTGLPKYLTSQVFLVGGFCTAFTLVMAVYKQGFYGLFDLLAGGLYSSSTIPNTTNN
jgi:hypothetical protein